MTAANTISLSARNAADTYRNSIAFCAITLSACCRSDAKDFFDSNPDEWEHRINSNLTPELPDHLNKSRYQISSQTEPYFWGPVGLDIDAMGYLYVVESNRHRVQIYTTRS